MSGPPSGLVPRTNNSSLGLGAVGGPRGAAAGVVQVLANFLVNYDRGNLQQLAQDIKTLQSGQIAAQTRLAQASARQTQLENSLKQTQQARLAIANSGGALAQRALQLQRQALTEEKQLGQTTQFTAQQRALALQRLEAAGVINAQQIGLLTNEGRLTQALAAARGQVTTATRENTLAQQQLNGALAAQSAFQAQARSGIGRLGSLGLGLVGGAIGGAVISGLFLEPLQKALGDVTKGIQIMSDAAYGAKEAAADLGQQVNDIADEEDISRLEAAAKIMERMRGGENADSGTTRALAMAGDLEALKAQAGEYDKVLALVAGIDKLSGQVNEKIARQQLYQTMIANGNEQQKVSLSGQFNQIEGIIKLQQEWGQFIPLGQMLNLDSIMNNVLGITDQTAQAAADHALAVQNTTAEVEAERQALLEAADAAAELRAELNAAAVSDLFDARTDAIRTSLDATVNRLRDGTEYAINAIRNAAERAQEAIGNRADARIDALQDKLGSLSNDPSKRTQGIQDRIDNLSNDPSARTNRLAQAIEDLNKAKEKAAYRAQLEDIDEQRHAILLRERLRLTNQQIDLDDFHGKDRLIAIDALIARQQKQNEAVDRFNKLLDIQYQLQQGVRRQQGETIREFTERRAQYYRGLLQQAAELNRAGPQAELEAERDRVQTSIDLKELEQKRRQIIEDRARALYLKSLQDQLRASQERDRKELESRRDSLRDQLEASKKADQAALEARRKALQDQIEQVRETARKEIDAVRDRADAEVEARERARDRAIETARAAAEKAIAAEEQRADAIRKFTSAAETDRLILAFKGAQNVAELQRFAGGLSGALYSLAYLQQSGQYLGLDPNTQAALLGNVTRSVQAYSQRMQEFARNNRNFAGGLSSSGGFAEGGVFMLNNSNTPIGRDIRWGDGNGDEIGVVLSNKVTQQLRDMNGAGSALVGGDMNIHTGENPYNARALWRREMRDMVREELSGR